MSFINIRCTEVLKMSNKNNDKEIKEKKTRIYTKAMMIRSVARVCGENYRTVREIYNSLEENIETLLSSANQNTDVSIRLFRGITINSSYVPEKRKYNNLTGEIIMAASRIKPKFIISRSYCEKLSKKKNK